MVLARNCQNDKDNILQLCTLTTDPKLATYSISINVRSLLEIHNVKLCYN